MMSRFTVGQFINFIKTNSSVKIHFLDAHMISNVASQEKRDEASRQKFHKLNSGLTKKFAVTTANITNGQYYKSVI